jgi:hypothetical protein
VVFPLVPKLWLENGLTEAGASAHLCSQAGAWEQEAKDLHPSNITGAPQKSFTLRAKL